MGRRRDGSRYVQGGSTTNWPLSRRALSRAGNWYASRAWSARSPTSPRHFGLIGPRPLRRLISTIYVPMATGSSLRCVFTGKVGRSVRRSACELINRAEGRSKMSAKIAVESFRVVTLMLCLPAEASNPVLLPIDRERTSYVHKASGARKTSATAKRKAGVQSSGRLPQLVVRIVVALCQSPR